MKTAPWRVCLNWGNRKNSISRLFSIKDLIACSKWNRLLTKCWLTCLLITDIFVHSDQSKSNGLEHVALIKGTWEKDEPSFGTGTFFLYDRAIFLVLAICECGEPVAKSIKMIEAAGKGLSVYMNQEGKVLVLMTKIAAYKLQEGL